MKELKPNSPCPCGSGPAYENCCKPYHDGKPVENALQLMKSRYTAYYLGDANYILKTSHPNNPSLKLSKDNFKEDVETFSEQVAFKGLNILNFEEKGDTAFVTFTAIIKMDDQDATFTEKSRFEKYKGAWLYESGEMLSPKL